MYHGRIALEHVVYGHADPAHSCSESYHFKPPGSLEGPVGMNARLPHQTFRLCRGAPPVFACTEQGEAGHAGQLSVSRGRKDEGLEFIGLQASRSAFDSLIGLGFKCRDLTLRWIQMYLAICCLTFKLTGWHKGSWQSSRGMWCYNVESWSTCSA